MPDVFKVSPGGRLPDARVYWTGCTPPVVVIVALYWVPFAPLGQVKLVGKAAGSTMETVTV